MTQTQLLDMKFYAQQLQESLTIAYWARDDHDKEYHTSRANEHLAKIINFKESV